MEDNKERDAKINREVVGFKGKQVNNIWSAAIVTRESATGTVTGHSRRERNESSGGGSEFGKRL